MNKKISLGLFILFTATMNMSCTDENDTKSTTSVSPIVEADLPTTANIGEEITFRVSHGVSNGCGRYLSQNTRQTGTTLTVTFYAWYREGVCTLDAPILETNYTFKPTKKGLYTFRFNTGNLDHLVKTIRIR